MQFPEQKTQKLFVYKADSLILHQTNNVTVHQTCT